MPLPSTAARLGAAALLFILALGVTGCPDEPTSECAVDTDCLLGFERCSSDGVCVDRLVDCFEDDDCEAGNICTNEVCVSGCRVDGDCASNEECNNNRCIVTEPGSRRCDTQADCEEGERCDGRGFCVPGEDLQCTGGADDPCEEGLPVASGFACKDYRNGRGPVCYFACAERTFCSALSTTPTTATTVNECPEGSICLAGGCRPSECSGPVSGQDECDAIARAEPDAYPNGALCERREINLLEGKPGFTITADNQTTQLGEELDFSFQCVPAGTAGEDEACSEGSTGIGGTPAVRCQRGLTCVKEFGLFDLAGQGASFCRKACVRDDQCGPEKQCIGEDNGQFDGAGICGDRCEPFIVSGGDCPDGEKCFAVSPEDGLCTDLVGAPGDLAAYGDCRDNGDADCPSGTICVSGQCLPQCDPTALTQEDANDQCFGGNPNAYLKVAHLAQNASVVDVYLDNVRVLDDLAFDAIGDADGTWFAVPPGEHLVEVVSGELETNRIILLEAEVDLEPNSATVFSALPADGADGAVQVASYQGVRKLSSLVAGRARLRVVHHVVGVDDVDVVVTAPDADVADPTNQVELVTDLAFGAATDYEAVDAGTYDVYVFPAGVDRELLNAAVVFEDVVLEEGDSVAGVAFGKVGGDNARTPGLKLIPQDEFRFIPRSGGYCFDLAASNGVEPSPGWGICFQECEGGPQAYGKNLCDSNGPAACDPFGTNLSVCFLQGFADVGEQCGTVEQGEGNFVEVDCVDGAFCDAAGNGGGICRSFCTTEGEPENPDLVGCTGDEVCIPSTLVSGLGQCRVPCTPEAPGVFIDRTNCPAGQQTCYPEDGRYFCHSDGGATGLDVGEGCEDSAPFGSDTIDCGPGALCATDVRRDSNGFEWLIRGFLTPEDILGETQTCRQLCRPFHGGDESDCPEDSACLPLLPVQEFNTLAGICIPKAEVTPGGAFEPDQCPGTDVGLMCGDASFCTLNTETIDAEAGQCTRTGSCLALCDKATNLGCGPLQECRALGSTEQTSLFIGTFGICRDI
jgi:hypothetical protein